MNIKAKEMYESKMMHVVLFGLILAFVSAAANTTFQNFNVAATGIISQDFPTTLLASYVLSVLALAICECLGGIIMVIFNLFKGIPLAEYGRVFGVRSSRTILISAIMGSPVATASAVMSIALCGSTYTNCIIGLTPAVTAIFGTIFLREKTGARVWLGIVIVTMGVLLATISPPEGVVNFYTGIALACVCPIAYTAENIISAHAVDVTDPMIACPMYRMIGSAIIEFIIVVCVCAVTGHIGWLALAFHIIFSSKMCLIYILCCGSFMALQYNGTYTSYTYCGATKAAAILWTGTFWTIPIGFTMSAMGILQYNVTTLGIFGAIAVVVGIGLVVAKPSELFSLRNNQ